MEKKLQTPDKGTETGEETEIEPEEKEDLGKGGGAEEIPQEPEPQPKIDYKQKFAESTREAQILLARVKQLEEKLGRVARDEIPAEQELQKLYPDWEMMGELERKLAEKTLILEKRIGKIEQEREAAREEAEWERQLETFLERAKILDAYPELEGREKEFQEFAKKPTHKGVDLNVLADAFLYKVRGEIMPKPKKGAVLEPGRGGPPTAPPKKKKMTPEELRILRNTDFKKYKQILTEHPDWIPEEIE